MADNRNLKTGFVDHNGARLYYESIGEGPTVVLTHAGITDMRLWDDVVNPLTEAGYSVLRYDARGFGQSTAETVPFTHEDDLKAVLDARELEQAILIGCSMGGRTALDFTASNPERVAALVLSGPIVNGYTAPSDWPEKLDLVYEAVDGDDYRKAADIEIGVWLVGVGRDRSEVDPQTLEQYILMDIDLLRMQTSGVFDLEQDPEPLSPPLERLTMPVLLVTGEYEHPFVIDHVSFLRRSIDHAEREVLTGTAHLPPAEVPQAFAQSVVDFLARHSD